MRFKSGFAPLAARFTPPAAAPPHALRAFLLRDGRLLVVAWLPTSAAPGTRLLLRDLVLPAPSAGEGLRHSPGGALSGSVPARPEGGRTVLPALELVAGEVTLVTVPAAGGVAGATSSVWRAPAPSRQSSR